MESNSNKEQWISEVMSSTSGIKKAEPDNQVYENVMAAIADAPVVRPVRFPIKQWAATAILLLAINAGSVVYFTSRKGDQIRESTSNPLAAEMQLNATYNY